MVAASGIKRTDPLIDAGLSLLWPGLGQLNQGRLFVGLYFAVETLALAIILVAAPSLRAVFGIGLLALTLWAMRAAHRAANDTNSAI